MTTRRDFIKKTVAGTAALSLGSILPGFGSSRYQDILGANEKYVSSHWSELER